MGIVEAESVVAMTPSHAAPNNTSLLILSGFLGAGKTTLLRRLVSGSHGVRITALVNDVAALDIDAALVAEVGGDTISLTNGCVCCSIAGGAARGMVDAMQRTPAPDAIVVEGSGVSDPYALAQVTAAVPSLALEGIVTVVDAAEAHRMDQDYLMRRQVTAADLILLNKTDLVSEEMAERRAHDLRSIAPRAQVVRTVDCSVPARVVLDPSRTTYDWLWETETEVNFNETDHAFCTMAFNAPWPVDRTALESNLANMPAGVLRAKGFIYFKDRPKEPCLLQMVGRRWTLEPTTVSLVDGRLVFIGTTENVDWSQLAERMSVLGLRPND